MIIIKLRKGDISIYDMKNLEFCTYHSREAYGGGGRGTWRQCMIFTGQTSLRFLMTLRCGLIALHSEWDIILF
ncbi:hypothetical protein HanOQP8_Chr04g0150621 [Helianthus annuus]|nr:hypothetical protein HanOQP8_Chr04g0150621 [Helianthus annuus]